jgi:hypothetical protein
MKYKRFLLHRTCLNFLFQLYYRNLGLEYKISRFVPFLFSPIVTTRNEAALHISKITRPDEPFGRASQSLAMAFRLLIAN